MEGTSTGILSSNCVNSIPTREGEDANAVEVTCNAAQKTLDEMDGMLRAHNSALCPAVRRKIEGGLAIRNSLEE